VNISGVTIAVVAAAVTVSGCGYRMGAVRPDDSSGTAPATATAAAAVRTGATAPAGVGTDPVPVTRALPPNAQGDPACASPLAWGRQPQGHGVLVTVWAESPSAVTVLVRTKAGVDVADRAVLERNDLQLFDFPEVGFDTVHEVLIMTNTSRCFAVADQATFR
jgi:hypothetical protein